MKTLNTDHIVQIVDTMSDVIIKNEVQFCELDSVAGDGDFGMSLAKGFRQLKSEWNDLSKDDISSFLKDSGMIIIEYCGGASGPIWGSAFRSAAKEVKNKKELTLKDFSEMLQASINGIQKRGGAKLGDKTLLDALIPAVESLHNSVTNDEDFLYSIAKSADAAIDGAEKTKNIVALKGRASYSGERSLNHPDAGAAAIGIIFKAISDNLSENV